MTETASETLPQLTQAIDATWTDLQTFLGSLSEKDASNQDPNGWNVKDHTTHLAAWEDSVAILFRGKPRHEALGIEEGLYQKASFDHINELIKERHSPMTLREAMDELHHVHNALMVKIRGLSDAQLKTSVRDFFPQAPRDDERTVIAFIRANTADHFAEHLPWMQALIQRAG